MGAKRTRTRLRLRAREPLYPEPASFWGGEELPNHLFGEVRLPPVPAALPKRLGNFPFWRGRTPFLEALESMYVAAGTSGLAVFLGLTAPPEIEARLKAPRPLQPWQAKATAMTTSPPEKSPPPGKSPREKSP